METLPLEVLWHILKLLSPLDISRVFASSRLLCARATPSLYRHLKINCQYRSGNGDNFQILKVLRHDPQLMSMIRTIEIIDHQYGFWTAKQLWLLDFALSSVIQYPSNILSFSTEIQWAPHDILFPNLVRLTYLGISTNEEAEWICWHLRNCPRLMELRLSFALDGARLAYGLLDITALDHITKLSLDRISLQDWAELPTWCLQSLDLRLCSGSEVFLKRMISKKQFRDLQVFRLAGHPASKFLHTLLVNLLNAPLLKELSLRAGKIFQPIHLAPYFTRSTSLKILIMDLRQNITVPQTAFKVGPGELQDIIAACPSLEFLGLPIDLRNPRFRRYRRLKFRASITAES